MDEKPRKRAVPPDDDRRKRLISDLKKFGALVGLGLLYLVWVRITGIGIPCVFRLITHLKCPGCGITRAIVCMSQFDFKGAYEYNMLSVTLVPVLAVYLICCEYRYIKTADRSSKRKTQRTLENILLAVMFLSTISYGISRNADTIGIWLVWWLLSIVTCGIYALWVSVNFKRWELSHTFYEDMHPVGGQISENSFYDGSVGERFGQELVCNLLKFLTCGLYSPWAVVRMIRFDFEHSVICGDRLQFNGTGSGYWGESSIFGLLYLITCGLYAP